MEKVRYRSQWQKIEIDPAFTSFADHLAYFASFSQWPSIDDLNAYASNLSCWKPNKGLCFTMQNPSKRAHRLFLKQIGLPSVLYYVEQIIQKAKIPTRPENWHDFLNALIWMNYPKTKHCLYQLYSDIAEEKWQKNQPRPKETDALTCFDEGGFIGIVDEKEEASIINILGSTDKEKKKSLLEEKKISVFVFGHGLLESYLAEHIDIHAKILVVSTPNLSHFSHLSLTDQRNYIDEKLSEAMQENRIFCSQQKGSFPFKFLTLAS